MRAQLRTIFNDLFRRKKNQAGLPGPQHGHNTYQLFQHLHYYPFANRHLQEIADVFIIPCRCGFHDGDLKDFVRLHKTALRKGGTVELWMSKDRIKTEVAIKAGV